MTSARTNRRLENGSGVCSGAGDVGDGDEDDEDDDDTNIY